MPYAFDTYSGTGSQTDFNISFPYINEDHVKVYVNYVNTSFTFQPNKSTARLASAPASGVPVEVRRVTPLSSVLVDYADGSTLTAGDLDTNNLQHLYIEQELDDIQNKAISLSPTTGLPTAGNRRVTEVADPTAAQDAVTKAYLERTGSITSTQLADGTIVNADVNASAAIAGTKISPNFGSQNIVTSGTVDGRDVSTDGTKLDGIETGATADQTAAEIRTLVESASDSNVFTDADHTKLNGIEASATADQTNAEIRAAVEAASDSNVFTDADHTKLNGIETAATADQTASEIKTLIASSPLDASHLAANSVTTSEIADAELTTLAGMQSGTASKLADSTALTADIADLNQIDGLTKQTTISDSDASFPTSGAVVDYVAAQIAPLGGLEVIATEVAFPNTQPASGVVISISDAGGVAFNGSGVSTTGRTVGGATVTINGAPSSLNGETLAAGVGLMVSSTGSSQTYNYHKILGKEDDIKQLSDDINDFNERYRVENTLPAANSSTNHDGDLVWAKDVGKMYVYSGDYNGTPVGSFGEVQSVGNFYISTFSESFDNSRTAFTVSNAPSNAQQLIISINGVIQKPNSGTGQPSEGFTLSGSTVTFSSAVPSGSDYFVVVLGSTVNIGTPSDNTITEAILQSNVVSEAKLKVSNSPTNGYFLQAQSGNSGGLTWAAVPDTSAAGVSGAIQINDGSDAFTAVNTHKITGDSLFTHDLYLDRDSSNNDPVVAPGSQANITYRTSSTQSGAFGSILDLSGLQLGRNTQYVKIKAQSDQTGQASWDLSLPITAGSNGQVLTTNGSGVTSWEDGASTVAGGAIYENSATISASHTIAAGTNGMSAGPVTINNGVTLTISSTSVYTVV